MSKDFKTSRQTKKRSNAPRQFLLLLAAYLLGYLSATVFDFTSLSMWVNKHIFKTGHIEVATLKANPKAALPKPKFEFYTLLAKDNSAPLVNRSTAPVPAPAPTATPAPVVASLPAPPPAASIPNIVQQVAHSAKAINVPVQTYLIQVASFNRKQDAENLKASLILRGFSVTINPVTQNNIIWHRVIIGPFGSRQEAEKAQIFIGRTERMKGMIRKQSG